MEVAVSARYSCIGRLANCSELSVTDTICERSVLTLLDERMKLVNKSTTNVLPQVPAKNKPVYKGRVYWRRKYYKPLVICPSECLENELPKATFHAVCISNGSENPSLSLEKHKDSQVLHEIGGAKSSMSMATCSEGPILTNAGAIEGSLAKHHDSDVKGKRAKKLGIYSADDSCSSSMINMEVGSTLLKTEVDENGECSSSGAFVGKLLGEDKSEEEICISIIRNHQQSCLLTNKSCTPEDDITSCRLFGDSCACSVCGLLGTTENMLICDQCEEAVHVSCCTPSKRNISFDEWFCKCCHKKKRKIMEEIGRNRALAASKDKTSPVTAMLNDSEPYKTRVRIGKVFQAVVHCWSGPIKENIDVSREPLELDPCYTEISTFHELSSEKLCKPKPLGNWLQCQAKVAGLGESDGITCGKWRRAPLFQVQSDGWDCFSSIFWDPKHADCAVPQELDTDEVMRQLKYIELLKPRLVVKKRKLDAMKANDSGKCMLVKKM